MYSKALALFTSDLRYANAFLEYGMAHEKNQISVKIYTKEESLEYAINNEKIELLLIDGICLKEKFLSYGCPVAVLSHERYISRTDYPVIFIYQKAEMIYKQIYGILSENVDEYRINCAISSDAPEIIGVYSPCYPLEREEFARALAPVIGEREKTLFINLAAFTEADYADEDGISELLFFLQQNGKTITYKLPSLIRQTDNYYSLPGVKHYLDLYSIEKEDIVRLMEQFEYAGNIKRVIIDIGLEGDNGYLIMQYCNKIYMPVNPARSRKRYEHYIHDINLESRDELRESIQKVELPEWWDDRKEMRINWTRTVVKEDFDI